jgi:hypothetical protein
MAAIVYLAQDLFFVSKIRATASQLGLEAERAPDAEALPAAARQARLVIVDLRLADALRALELLAADPATAGVRSVGFVDHENLDLMRSASARGCGTVLSKRRFSSDLPALLAACRA